MRPDPETSGAAARLGAWCFGQVWRAFAAGTALLLLATAGGIAASLLFQPLFDKGLIARDGSILAPIVAGQVALLLVRNVLAGAAFDLLARAGAGLGSRLTLRVFDHLQRHSLPYFLERGQADLLQLLRGDVVVLEASLGQLAGQALIASFQTLAVLAALLAWKPELALLCAAGLGTGAVVTSLAARLSNRALAREIGANAKVAEHLLRTLGLRGFLLRVQSSAAWPRARLETRLADYRGALISRRVGPNWALAGAEAIGTVTYYLFYLVGGALVAGGGASAGELVAMAALLSYLTASANQLAPTFVGLKDSWLRLKRIERELALPPAMAEPAPRAPLPQARGAFALEAVTVRYGTAEALATVSLAIAPGRVTCIVGPSGAGKTTLTLLLLRLIEPSAGRVVLDGLPLAAYPREVLWQRVGYVPQEPILFQGSVWDNLTLGRTLARPVVEAACAAVGIHERIVSDPAGYDADVGEAGYRFSAGERQRLVLARALAAAPAILVLDEPTAHLDAATEEAIRLTIGRQRDAGRTVLVVTHNPATLALADDVVALAGGRLAQDYRATLPAA